MMIVEEVLQEWRGAERLLEELPPLDPDHETVALAVASLRQIYQSITSDVVVGRSHAAISETHETIVRTRELLAAVRDNRKGRQISREV